MSGITEILLIVAIILGMFMLPRLLARKPDDSLQTRVRPAGITGPVRVAVLLSLFWPALIALFVEPWNGRWPLFFYLAAGPVVLLWGIWWVVSGFRREKGERRR